MFRNELSKYFMLMYRFCYGGFEVLTVVVVKNFVFWDITPCNMMKFNSCIGGALLVPDSCQFLAWPTLQPWKWRQHVPTKHQLTFTGPHSVISQKTELIMMECEVFEKNAIKVKKNIIQQIMYNIRVVLMKSQPIFIYLVNNFKITTKLISC
jgi:hypothetical protein